MSVAITHKVKRMLQRLAVCPECGTPAKLIVTQKLIAWSCERCLKARAGDGEAQTPAPDSELGAALDGMANRGMISAEQAEHARRRISAQKGVAV